MRGINQYRIRAASSEDSSIFITSAGTGKTRPALFLFNSRIETNTYRFTRHIVLAEVLGSGLAPESRLVSRSFLRQTACMEAEMDCRLQSNSSSADSTDVMIAIGE